MTDTVFIDSSIFIKFFVEGKNYFERISKSILITSYNVIEEVAYILLKFRAMNEIKEEKHYKAVEFLRKNPEKLKEFMKEIETDLKRLLENYGITLVYPRFDEFFEISKTYGLLPNDALIAATCKYYGISKIATFDEDFERVDFLEMVKV